MPLNSPGPVISASDMPIIMTALWLHLIGVVRSAFVVWLDPFVTVYIPLWTPPPARLVVVIAVLVCFQ